MTKTAFTIPFLTIALLSLLIHFLFFRYSFPHANADEASFFSPAYTLAEHGNLSSPLHRSFLQGADTYTYWMPPLYMIFLGGWLKLTGSTILAAKFLSMFLILVTAYVLTRMADNRNAKFWIASLFLICPFVIISSAFIRMEALGLSLLAVSMVLVKFKSSPQLLGLLAGLCVMTHPLLLACTAALALVSLQRGWKTFLVFSLVTLIVVSPYLYYILQNTELFRMQMALQFARKMKANLEDLQTSYLIQAIPLSLLGLWYLLRGQATRDVKIFLATGLILTLVVLIKSNEFNYQVYTIPYILGCLAPMLDRKEPVNQIILPIAVYIFFALTLFAKLNKYHFETDREYRSLISYLRQHPLWKGRQIFVYGNPDVAGYFIEEGEDVQRDIPIAPSQTHTNDQFNYVVEVFDRYAAIPEDFSKPWYQWPSHITVTSATAHYTMHVYVK